MDQAPGPDSVEIKNGFILFGRFTVTYEGRASSTLELGNYLLLRKPDGSTMVHGADLTTPLNYQPAGSRMYQAGWTLTVLSRKEKMVIEVQEVLNVYRPREWSCNRIRIIRTEKQLRDQLVRELERHIPGVVDVRLEFPTEHGPIDLVGIDSEGVWHVVELKRHRISVAAAVQLRKYLDALTRAGHRVKGYVAAPAIIPGAAVYCDRQGYRYIEVQHRETL